MHRASSQLIPIAARLADSRPVSTPVVLPFWGLALILAGLVGFCALLVTVGWLLVVPHESGTEHAASFPQPASLAPGIEAPATPEPEWTLAREAAVVSVAKLRRRLTMPAQANDAPIEPVVAASTPPPAPTLEEISARLRTPAPWRQESKRHGKADDSVLQALERAQAADAAIPYAIRRFADLDAPKPLKLAITPFVHDDVGSILMSLGAGYRFKTLPKWNLQSIEILKRYDVLFLTCADLYAQDFQAAAALRRFVELGGTLYASDLQYDLLARAFPEYVARTPMQPGVQQTIAASVLDAGLQARLGHKAIPLIFEAHAWRPAAFDPEKTTVYLQGVYRNQLGQPVQAPLLVTFRHRRGTVIFTSFHHSRNDSMIVRKLLEFLVFSSINARSEARVRELMHGCDLRPTDLCAMLVALDKSNEHTYEHQGGGLKITLGFEHSGARLKLTLRAPDGKRIEHEDQSLFQIEIPAAAPGDWQYRITAVALPHDHSLVITAIGAIMPEE